MKRRLVAFIAIATLAWAAAAQVEIVTDEDALFGDAAEETVEAVKPSTEGSALATFLKTEGVRIGGSFSGSVDSSWKLHDPWRAPALDERALDAETAGALFFDARPDEDFRVYGKIKSSWPFQTTKTFLTGATTSDSITVPNLQVFELFADWNYKDALFLRFGKHTVKWGVGYFFSPADVLNLSAIDLLDPTAQREGPVSLRVHYPILGTQTNLWAYAILPSAEDELGKPEYLAGAAKLEFLLAKAWEIGIGGYYKYDSAPRAVLTASGSFWKLNVFGEAVGSWGSDKIFVTSVDAAKPQFITTEKRESEPFFSGTAGFTYSNADDNWSAAFQYFYNGDGYSESERDTLIDQARSEESAIKTALSLAGLPASTYSAFLKGLIYNSGRHYAALSLSKSELFTEDLSVGLFAMANLSDFSGFVTPSISYELFDRTELKIYGTFAFGGSDSEHVVLNDGTALTIGFKASLGSGNF